MLTSNGVTNVISEWANAPLERRGQLEDNAMHLARELDARGQDYMAQVFSRREIIVDRPAVVPSTTNNAEGSWSSMKRRYFRFWTRRLDVSLQLIKRWCDERYAAVAPKKSMFDGCLPAPILLDGNPNAGDLAPNEAAEQAHSELSVIAQESRDLFATQCMKAATLRDLERLRLTIEHGSDDTIRAAFNFLSQLPFELLELPNLEEFVAPLHAHGRLPPAWERAQVKRKREDDAQPVCDSSSEASACPLLPQARNVLPAPRGRTVEEKKRDQALSDQIASVLNGTRTPLPVP